MSRPVWSSIWRRSRVLVPGVVLGMLFAAFVSAIFTGPSFNGFGYVWWLAAAGPVSDLGLRQQAGHAAPVGCCLLALTLLIPAHPIRPNGFTATLTLLGLAAWYFQGFLFALLTQA